MNLSLLIILPFITLLAILLARGLKQVRTIALAGSALQLLLCLALFYLYREARAGGNNAAFIFEDGYVWYKGREDDLISSGGYRIGPTDIEDCLIKHEAVLMAAAVGVPDPVRGESVRAFVVPRPGVAASPALADEIRRFVGGRLAWYQAPRDIVFVDELPLTATGKIIRRELRGR